MTKVLTLDLGITTGWCVRGVESGDCIAAGYDEWPGENNLPTMFRSYVDRYLPSYVVIEAPVLIARGELQGKLAALIREAKAIYRQNTEWVTPAEWKPRYRTHPIPPEVKLSSTHTRDAYRIAEWWLKTKRPSTNVAGSHD